MTKIESKRNKRTKRIEEVMNIAVIFWKIPFARLLGHHLILEEWDYLLAVIDFTQHNFKMFPVAIQGYSFTYASCLPSFSCPLFFILSCLQFFLSSFFPLVLPFSLPCQASKPKNWRGKVSKIKLEKSLFYHRFTLKKKKKYIYIYI